MDHETIDWGLEKEGHQGKLRRVCMEMFRLWADGQEMQCWRNLPLLEEVLQNCGSPFEQELRALSALTSLVDQDPTQTLKSALAVIVHRAPRRNILLTAQCNDRRLFWFPRRYVLTYMTGIIWARRGGGPFGENWPAVNPLTWFE